MRALRRCLAMSLAASWCASVAAAQSAPAPPSPADPSPPAVAPPPPGPASESTADSPPPAAIAPPGDPRVDALEQQVRALAEKRAEQRIDALEQKLRALEEKRAEPRELVSDMRAAPTKAAERGAAGGTLAQGPDGATWQTTDGKFVVRFRPVIHVDARFFLEGGTNTFLLRRVRPTFEGTVFDFFDWRLTPELAGNPFILDAFVNVRLFREIQLRVGKFNSPVGYERLLRDSDLPFVERGITTNLVPNRDTGIQLHGDVLGGTLVYAAGLFNGAPDGVNYDSDDNDAKDVIGRIVLRPFQPTFIAPLRNLGLGIATTRGTHVGRLPPYRTPVQTPFFAYADGVAAGGTLRRLVPQAYFYFGPFGMFGEYVRSTHIIVAPGQSARVHHQAWQVAASFLLTGEEASSFAVTPKRQLDPRRGGFGALELVARVGQLRIDDEVFRRQLADSSRSARKATNVAFGLNWHMARSIKWMVDYEHTSFAGHDAMDVRPSESLVLTRLQAAY